LLEAALCQVSVVVPVVEGIPDGGAPLLGVAGGGLVRVLEIERCLRVLLRGVVRAVRCAKG